MMMTCSSSSSSSRNEPYLKVEEVGDKYSWEEVLRYSSSSSSNLREEAPGRPASTPARRVAPTRVTHPMSSKACVTGSTCVSYTPSTLGSSSADPSTPELRWNRCSVRVTWTRWQALRPLGSGTRQASVSCCVASKQEGWGRYHDSTVVV